MSARKLKTHEFEHIEETVQTPLYQDYTPETSMGANVKEILFFVNIACFGIFMALFSFIFIAAMFVSFALLKLQRMIIKQKMTK